MHFPDQAIAVLSVLALAGGLALLARRRQGGALWPGLRMRKPERLLVVEERLALGPQHALYLVRLADRRLLGGTAPGAVNFGPEAGEFGWMLRGAAGSTEHAE